MPRAAPRSRRCLAVVALLGLVMLPVGITRAAASDFPRPPQLEPDVQFWQRIYTKVTTQAGLLHDDRYLDVVYEELTFAPGLSPRERSDLVDAARTKYERMLRKLASSPQEHLTDDEQRVLKLFPPNVGSAALREAADHVRFQLGQADRFKEGLTRAGAWERHVEETLQKQGLPPELSALPHVESSFNPRAYSKVGAAGMWQFMRSTGRRWLRVDNVVDERLDPYKSTVAAAQFLGINYSILGTWPLALTAYNHGVGGMRRAKELMGTDDIVTILRSYQSRSFGFASRNFYVSFLAALEIDRDVDRFFGQLERLPPDTSRTLRLPHYIPVTALERALGTDRETLRGLNLALMDPVWNGQRFVPRGFELRIPAAGVKEPDRLLAAVAAGERFADQKRDAAHRVRRGETLERIATAYAVRPAELLALNGLTDPKSIKPGMTLKLPPLQPISAAAAVSAAAAPVQAAAGASSPEVYVVRSGDVLSDIARRFGLSEAALMSQNAISDRDFLFEGQTLNVAKTPSPVIAAVPAEPASHDEAPAEEARVEIESARSKPQPVSREQAAEYGPGLVPGIESAASADPSDYSVAGDTAIVQGAETLGHFADWLSVSASRLRALNHMPAGSVLALGRRIRLDLSRVDAATFEERRMRFHRQLQDDFFQRYKIIGHERHRLKSGESLWTLTQKTNVPVWLLRQYNPETDFTTVRVGTMVVLPKVESVAASAAPAAAPTPPRPAAKEAPTPSAPQGAGQ
ncbi:MAG TPA: LysM peptidoglycan-binding domain-containing protein [Steroidobacteraceae bacterium]|nr:LysM peptidoglycan-binding domain-containing protein [Steroidobacteraceae bacterium]